MRRRRFRVLHPGRRGQMRNWALAARATSRHMHVGPYRGLLDHRGSGGKRSFSALFSLCMTVCRMSSADTPRLIYCSGMICPTTHYPAWRAGASSGPTMAASKIMRPYLVTWLGSARVYSRGGRALTRWSTSSHRTACHRSRRHVCPLASERIYRPTSGSSDTTRQGSPLAPRAPLPYPIDLARMRRTAGAPE